MKYNRINIYFRTCSFHRNNPDRPHYFSYEAVWRNFLAMVNWDLCNVTVLFEGDYNNYFIKDFEKQYPFKVKFIDSTEKKWKHKCFESYASWSRAVAAGAEAVKNDNLSENELLYLLDDDYAHLNSWPEVVLDLFNTYIDENSYCCLYDNSDKYLCRHKDRTDSWSMYKDLTCELIISGYRHWKSSPNMGMACIMPVKLFNEHFDLWGYGASDCYIGNEVSTKRGTKIWISVPGMASHLIYPWLSPFISWESVLENIKV